MTPVLQIDGLSLTIEGKAILDRVSLSVHAGEIVGLVGRSGSGKSMTGLAAMRLSPENTTLSGQVSLNGANLLTLSEDEMCAVRGRDIAMVFQEPMTALNPLHSIGAQVAETLLIHSDISKTAALREAGALLARVGLSPDEISPGRLPHELSGGQRQRVVIAIAIAMKPKVLIADEPTTSLDVTTQAEILALLKDLARQDGMGLLLITHDLAIILNMADRIAIMQQGRIVETATPRTFSEKLSNGAIHGLTAQRVHRKAPSQAAQKPSAPVMSAADIVCAYPLPKASLFAPREEFRAVDGLSLSIRKGENIGLVGESGCGKSTFARAILGLTSLAGGQIKIGQAPFPAQNKTETRALRRKVQIVFQDPYSSFNPRCRIDQIIAEPLNLLEASPAPGTKLNRVAEALTAVGLSPDDGRKYPHQFSGGQRQRIAIARALMTNPELIVLDEATSALDVTSRNHVLSLLMRLSEEKEVSYLFITHDLSIARDITDRVLVMKAGRIVEEGATQDIFAAPQHPYTQSLLNAAPVLGNAASASP